MGYVLEVLEKIIWFTRFIHKMLQKSLQERNSHTHATDCCQSLPILIDVLQTIHTDTR